MKASIEARALVIFGDNLRNVRLKTERVFFWLLLLQWAAAIAMALLISPYAWVGKSRAVHLHVEIAVFGGFILNLLPITLMYLRPGAPSTRHVVAITQMLWSAVFVHLTGGRIETHFHIFVSLAFLSFYRDRNLLITATAVVAADHLSISFFWPESVYGIYNPEWWRFLEHAAWTVFEDVILWLGSTRAIDEMKLLSEREATLEVTMHNVEVQVAERTEELRTSSDRYRALIENTSTVPWEVNATSCDIVYVAPQMQSIFGLSTLAEPNANFLSVFHPEDREPFRRFIAAGSVPARNGERHIDSRIQGADKIVHVRSFVADRTTHVSTGTVYGISLDITRQKQLEQELIQAQKLESIGQLSAGIAHEINTPTQFIGDNIRFLQESVGEVFRVLEVIASSIVSNHSAPLSAQSLTEMLTSADLPYLREEVPKAIAESLEGIDRISKIVGAMKEFSHPAVDRKPYDINRAIASTITVASNEWKYVAEVKTDFDALLTQVTVMPGAFNQVILNILVNAAHAIAAVPLPVAKGIITVSTRKIDEWAEIRIYDSGCGVPENIRARIFDPFFTTKAVGKGTGQGLAIAHDVVVKKHGGTITLESNPEGGSIFIIRLPIDASSAESAVAA